LDPQGIIAGVGEETEEALISIAATMIKIG
jgi:hypothetical protein